MKKLSLLVGALLACFVQVNAQEYVSTEPQNKNVLIEEFTGRNCGYCPAGHVIANQIVHNNPDRVWAMNIHAGGYAPTTYPNMNTTDGTAICNGFDVTGFPAGVVNRSTSSAVDRGQWAPKSTQELALPAVCNVDGQVVINPVTRTAKITVEVYYTGDNAEGTNYLTIAMLQDSIIGSQGGSSSNPAQVINGQYCHMHILRDIITDTWGDEISPTTAGTLITKEYVYEIPTTIGSPNGVEVDLDNVLFLAYVTEKHQGTPTRPILNVNELYTLQGTEDAISPMIVGVTSTVDIACTTDRTLSVDITNGGLDEITSLKFESRIDGGEPVITTWEGSIPSYQVADLEIELEIPVGEHQVEVKIVEANGTAYEYGKTISLNVQDWAVVDVEGETEEITIEIMQDKYGNQLTWEVLASDGSVIAEGGPYQMLVGGATATQLHEEKVTVPAGDCIKFVIKDAVGNGMCCNFGEGYYQIKDSKGNLLVDGDGDFGSEASALLSIGAYTSVQEMTSEAYNVFPNPVKEVLTIKGENMQEIVIYNSVGQMVEIINCNNDEVKVNVSSYQNGMYFINVVNNNGEVSTSKVSVLH